MPNENKQEKKKARNKKAKHKIKENLKSGTRIDLENQNSTRIETMLLVSQRLYTFSPLGHSRSSKAIHMKA